MSSWRHYNAAHVANYKTFNGELNIIPIVLLEERIANLDHWIHVLEASGEGTLSHE